MAIVSATGNVTGNFFIGNGSQLTGLPATYGNSNVATFLAAYGSNTISTSGNITAGNLIGNISIIGNVTGTQSNVTLIAGSYSWVFDNTGNLTIPNVGDILLGNTQSTISAAGNITGGNLLFGTGIVTGTGNITGGNLLFGTGVVTGTGNITGGNLLFGTGVVTGTGNITGGNILTGGIISATGNLTSGNLSVTGNTATITTANYSIGYLNIPQITLSANSTAALTDSGKHYYSTTAGNLQLTLPDNGNVAFPIGTALSVVLQAAGNIIVTTQASTTLYMGGNATAGNRVISTYGMATIMKVATNTWFINGTGVS